MSTIFCFTNTGNSLAMSKQLADLIDAEVISMTGDPVDCNDNVIGFVFPVHFWGLPLRVEHFVERLNITNKSAYVFTVITYGGVFRGASGELKNLLENKGIPLQYSKKVKSVENYIPRYKVKDTEELHLNAHAAIESIAFDITQRKTCKAERFTFLNRLFKGMFPAKDPANDLKFNVSDACNACGSCARVCPVGNISMVDGRPTFLHGCEHCITCMHACPVGAINWMDKTQNKARYRNPGISRKELEDFMNDR